jgi:hypothetical protein
MNYNSRIRQVEKQAGKGDGTVDITVNHWFDRDIEPEYAKHRARQILRIRPPDENEQQIFVVGTEMEEKYRNMTPEQAQEILNRVLWTKSKGQNDGKKRFVGRASR